jgi:protein MpaA
MQDLTREGLAARRRTNAHGVDLNRNFPAQWRPIGRRGDPQCSGRRPLSERDTRLACKLIWRLRPAITIWFRQPEAVVRGWGRWQHRHRSPLRRYRARRPPPAGMAGRKRAELANHRFPNSTSFVVELPAGQLERAVVERYAHAVMALP